MLPSGPYNGNITPGIDRLSLAASDVSAFCRRWRISELALVGARLGDSAEPESDIDLLVTFAADASWTLLDHLQMQGELSELLGRPVDWVNRRATERSANRLRKRQILGSARDASRLFLRVIRAAPLTATLNAPE
ncbi:MAG: nucleotidyltransferase family protein [Phycisphaerae bacterium]